MFLQAPQLLIVSYHESIRAPCIKSGVKQGCVLAPTLFGIFFLLLLSDAFDSFTDGVYPSLCGLRSSGKGKGIKARDHALSRAQIPPSPSR